ncbi:MAG: hypothetical protein V3U20_09270 [Thermoplasmata archaeon]
MNTMEIWIVTFLIIFLVILILLAVFISRKVKGGELPKGDVNQLLPNIDYMMRFRGWQTKVYPYKGKITVTKDSIIATDIHLIQQPDGRIDILHATNAGITGWVLIIILIFVVSIVGLILAIILHINSRKFAKEEVIPMIVYHMYGPAPSQYPPPIPQQIYPCQSCGQPLRYVEEYQKWFCENCGKYV